MKYLMWTPEKKLLGNYSPIEKFFKKWMWNCEIMDHFSQNDELYRYFYEYDNRSPAERLQDNEMYIDEL